MAQSWKGEGGEEEEEGRRKQKEEGKRSPFVGEGRGVGRGEYGEFKSRGGGKVR